MLLRIKSTRSCFSNLGMHSDHHHPRDRGCCVSCTIIPGEGEKVRFLPSSRKMITSTYPCGVSGRFGVKKDFIGPKIRLWFNLFGGRSDHGLS